MTSSIFSAIIMIFLAGLGLSLPGFEYPDINYSYFGANVFSEDIENKDIERFNPFESLELEAQSVLVLDMAKDKIIFAQNAEVQRPLASLTKLATAAVVDELAVKTPAENRNVLMALNAISQTGDDGFLVNESFSVHALLGAMLVKSSNDAARALALWAEKNASEAGDSYWFVNQMNLLAASLGLQATHFFNETGLDLDSELSGGYGSAKEILTLFTWLVKNKPQLIEVSSQPRLTIYSIEGKKHVLDSSAEGLMSIPELLAAKTGFTELAGGNLVFAFGLGPGRQFAVAVLGSSFDGRFADALKIYEATKEWIKL